MTVIELRQLIAHELGHVINLENTYQSGAGPGGTTCSTGSDIMSLSTVDATSCLSNNLFSILSANVGQVNRQLNQQSTCTYNATFGSATPQSPEECASAGM